jgi:hypothetical protein
VFIEVYLISRSFYLDDNSGNSYFRNVDALILNNYGKCSDVSNNINII